jgi:hypothetical protein
LARRRRIVLLALVVGVVCAGFTTPASAAPSNDDFGDARAVRLGADVKGTVNGATKQRGEPRHAGSLASRSVWYRFRARRKESVLLGTCKADFDTVVAVYSGRRLASLREVDFNNDGCGSGSRVSFTARRGRTYRIAVLGFVPRGRFTLTVSRIDTPPNDDFVDAVRIRVGETISGTSRNATRELREPAHQYNHAHTVWFKLSVAAPTAVRVSNCSANTADSHVTVYTGSRVSALTRVSELDDDCSPTFDAQPGVVYRIVVEDGDGAGGGVRLTAQAA